MGSRPRAQSPLSVNKTSQWQLACVFRHTHPALQRGYKRRAHANANQLFVIGVEPSANLFPDEFAESPDSARPSISFGEPADDRMSIAASEDELVSGNEDSACAACVRKRGDARVRSRADCYAFLGRRERRAALASSFSWMLEAGRLVPEAQAAHRQLPAVPFQGDGLRPILDLRVLNRALHKLPFWMLMQNRIFQCIRPFDWFAAIDLKDAYFHVSILPRNRPFLRFALKSEHYSTRSSPSGYPCRLVSSPRLWRQPLFLWGKKAFVFSTSSTTG